jgi:HAD superfamily hydrolase (TIGR01490 family)
VGRTAAFFDLDKTVIARSSALAFSRPFYRDGLITRRDLLVGGYAQLMYRLAGATEEQMLRTRDYLAELCRGWPVDQVRQVVAETLHELIDPYVYVEATALIERHRAAGRDIVLVSSSGLEMVRPIGELVGADHVIATRMAIADGRYTGEIDFYAAGPNKAVAVLELAERNGYDLDSSYAYSDSVIDLPLLETVGYPTVVNPDRPLRRAALERHWPILAFRRPVPPRRGRVPRAAPGTSAASPVPAAVLAGVGAAALAGIVWYGYRRTRATRLPTGQRPALANGLGTVPADRSACR